MNTKAARDGASGTTGTAGAGAGSGDRAAVAKEAGVDPRDVAYVPLGSLRADPRNPKAHDEGLIGASINRFGLLDVIVQDGRTGYIVSGHGRQKVLRAMKERGEVPPEGVLVDEQTGDWQVPVIVGWSSRSDTEAAAALIALNRSTELGGWVDDSLLGLLDMLVEEDDSALAVVGFGEDEIEVLRTRVSTMEVVVESDNPEPVEEDDFEVELPAEPVSRVGDLWVLGDHRVLCGDATKAPSYETLLGTDRANGVWTDPPYGVSYTGKTGKALTILNDGLDGLEALLKDSWDLLLQFTVPGSAVYVSAPSSPRESTIYSKTLLQVGLFRQRLVWVKNTFALGHADYHYRHEDIYFGYVPGAGRVGRGGPGWYGDNAQSTVLEFSKPARNSEHPTMKPLALVAYCLTNSSREGDLILDMFAGSGSTLMACEQLGRRAALIELDPRYVDVICRRFQTMTGIVPVRDGEPVDFLGAYPA